jgi:VWFA-related protein
LAEQQPSEAAEVTSRQTPAVFRSSTNLVQVPVVVRDSSGHAVGTLRAEDFELFDGSKPQTISRFSVERFGTSESTQRGTTSHGSNTAVLQSSSETKSGTLPSRFTALLADDVNLSLTDFVRGRNAALHYLDTLGSDERIAVYSASGRATLDFTDDRDRLREKLESINSVDANAHYQKNGCRITYYNLDLTIYQNATVIGCPDGGHVNVSGEQAFAEMWYLMQTWGETDETTYLRILRDLVAKMSVIPGQRSILLLSPGIYVPARYQQQFKDILSSAIRAHVIVNAVDVRGVLGSGRYTGQSGPPKAIDPSELGDQVQGGDFMADITSGTGGIYIHSDNDLDGAIERAESVPEFVYLLAFSPTDVRFDGKRHTLNVRLKNPHGFTLQARNSYFADSYSSDPADEAKRQIEEAFFSSQEVNGLPVELRTRFFKDGDDATLTVTSKVDAAKLPFRKEDGRNRDDLTLVVGLFDQNGNFISAFQKVIEMRLKDATLDAWIKAGIEVATDFNVKPGKYLVRLVVRDSEGSSMAEQSTGVEIPW